MTLTDIDAAGAQRPADLDPDLFLARVRSELDYAFQPIVDIHSGDVHGHEALVRKVDRFGFIAPHDLFDHAESLGCFEAFKLALRRKAIAKFASIDEAVRGKMFMNIDGRILAESGFLLEQTAIALAAHGLQPCDVCMELTETYDIASVPGMSRFMTESRRMGFGFAVDDFGRGHSQLKILYDHTPDILKLDRSFVIAACTDSRMRLLVSSVADLAHNLGMRVIAEGVETEAELVACAEIGCDLAQGYHIAVPTRDVTGLPAQYDIATRRHGVRGHEIRSDAGLVHAAIDRLTPLRDTAPVSAALEYFSAPAALPIVPVVNAAGEAKGIVRESDLKAFLYLPFGRDLLHNRSVDNRLEKFICRCPVADIHTRTDKLIDAIAAQPVEGAIITRNGRYYGFVSTSAFLKVANEIRLREAEDRNPLTKLAGNTSVSAHVTAMAMDPEADRCFCYIDLDNFKPFNDTYGFRTGDRAIILFAELVKRKLADRAAFIGHVGGDDFFVSFKDQAHADVVEKMVRLRDGFAHRAESLYSTEHRDQGYIEAHDRQGVLRRFPLLSCSIAVLQLPKPIVVGDSEELSRRIAMLKRQSKRASGGVVSACYGGLERSGGDEIVDPTKTTVATASAA